jgi:hypothetical protein
MICLNAECDGKRLCCLTCIDDIHRKHELISLYKFDNMLKVLTEQLHPDVRNAIMAELREFEGRLLKVRVILCRAWIELQIISIR